ncbi:glycosyltransferase [Rhabdochromatium marinum]|uniref:glycosyltransferase n=1 Tax=Rhabdochromatium marinum TaxID=48729 RepID=UPI0019049B36|nr:glycosyltransferase [Rhabdochromatium marinum]MBK1649785.1 hypothetical protein [Rhabdochromatium marinum]
MHILILPSWYPIYPGDINGVFFREQALALARHGHQVGVITLNLRSLRQWRSVFTGRHGVQYEIDAGIPTLRLHGTAWFPRLLPKASAWLWLRHGRRLFEQYVAKYGKPDLIHVHSMLNAGVLAQDIQQRYRIPYVVTEHFTGYARGTLRPAQLRIAATVARHAARRLGVSQPLCDLLQQQLGAAAGIWEEMPNIVEQRFLARPLARRVAPDENFRFVCVALLTEKKGIHDLLQAFAKQFATDAQVTLDIGGDGVERPRLEQLAAHLGIKDRVRFHGALSRDQVVELMEAADAFVLASRYETFGVVVIEALALGKPVIATRCGGPESIIRAQDGLLVPTRDINALAEAMQQIRENAGCYQADVIRADCASRYSEKAVVDRLTKIYQHVIYPHA